MSSILEEDIPLIWATSMRVRAADIALARSISDIYKAVMSAAEGSNPQKIVLLTLLAGISQDYSEVLLMWMLGVGDGAQKLLRPLYEKALTFLYLSLNPCEIDDFKDYSDIHWHKLLNELFSAGVDPEKWLTEEEIKRINESYEKNKHRYQTTLCRKCGTKRATGSWTKRSNPELATKVGASLPELYFHGFLQPTLSIHPTFVNLRSIFTIADDKIVFDQEIRSADNDIAFSIATTLLVRVIRMVNMFFGLDKRELVDRAETLLNDSSLPGLR